MKYQAIIQEIEKVAPLNLMMNWDNSGLIVGDPNKEIKNVAVALELTGEVIDFVSKHKIDLLILHHPPLFHGKLNIESANFKPLLKKSKDIVVYAAHSTLDRTHKGTSYALAQELGLNVCKFLDDGTIICKGNIPFGVLLKKVRIKLKISLKYNGDMKKKHKLIAIHSGEAFTQDHMNSAMGAGATCYIGGDVTHHQAEYAVAKGLSFIDATHVRTEIPGIKTVYFLLKEKFPNLKAHFIDQKEEYWRFLG